jgi:hypothetical protein
MSTANKLVPNVLAKTSAYTFNNSDWGAIFTNRGATGSVTFTLPAVAGTPAGAYVIIYIVADFEVVVAATSGELVTFNNAAADTVTITEASEHIGAGLTFICDGTSWLTLLHTEESQTVAVA